MRGFVGGPRIPVHWAVLPNGGSHYWMLANTGGTTWQDRMIAYHGVVFFIVTVRQFELFF